MSALSSNMLKSEDASKLHDGGHGSHRKQATYALCVVFWLIVVLVLAILYFALFKPKDPDVEVQTIELSKISSYGVFPHINSVNLSLTLLVLLNNPNRGVFHYSLSTAFLYHNGAEVGYRPIPGGHVDELEAVDLSITISPEALSLLQGPYIRADVASGSLTLNTAVVFTGHVNVLGVFPHHATSAANCTVVISLAKGSLQGYTCINNISLE